MQRVASRTIFFFPSLLLLNVGFLCPCYLSVSCCFRVSALLHCSPSTNPPAVSCCRFGRWQADTCGCRGPRCAVRGSGGSEKWCSQSPRAGMGMGAPSWGPFRHPCSSRRVAKKSVSLFPSCVSLTLSFGLNPCSILLPELLGVGRFKFVFIRLAVTL